MTTRRPSPVRIKRAYVAPSDDDGRRVLVDRMWPRGMARARLALDDWRKDAAPSDGLRRWFGHDPRRWAEFLARYRAELSGPPGREAVADLVRCARQGPLTLVYAASDEAHNNAVALRELIVQQLSQRAAGKAP
jgi:uncharacterized protein YeaO (DUF488 family)